MKYLYMYINIIYNNKFIFIDHVCDGDESITIIIITIIIFIIIIAIIIIIIIIIQLM